MTNHFMTAARNFFQLTDIPASRFDMNGANEILHRDANYMVVGRSVQSANGLTHFDNRNTIIGYSTNGTAGIIHRGPDRMPIGRSIGCALTL